MESQNFRLLNPDIPVNRRPSAKLFFRLANPDRWTARDYIEQAGIYFMLMAKLDIWTLPLPADQIAMIVDNGFCDTLSIDQCTYFWSTERQPTPEAIKHWASANAKAITQAIIEGNEPEIRDQLIRRWNLSNKVYGILRDAAVSALKERNESLTIEEHESITLAQIENIYRQATLAGGLSEALSAIRLKARILGLTDMRDKDVNEAYFDIMGEVIAEQDHGIESTDDKTRHPACDLIEYDS